MSASIPQQLADAKANMMKQVVERITSISTDTAYNNFLTSMTASSGAGAAAAMVANGLATMVVGEVTSGWQTLSFATPISISANTLYTASYHTYVGYYSASPNYFTTDHVSGVLTAPSSSSVGGNGVYTSSAIPAIPTSTYNNSNYWVDITFTPSGQSNTSYSLFSATDVPALLGVNDLINNELGVKFTSSIAGTVTGIRFYKSALNTPPHIGNLWTTAGNSLGQTSGSSAIKLTTQGKVFVAFWTKLNPSDPLPQYTT